MATYKAEFLSHYYEGRLRRRSAYAFGLIPYWARPGQPNARRWPTSSPRRLCCATWPRRRSGPPRAPDARLRRRRPSRPGSASARPAQRQRRRRSILWPDTFNNYFYPQTAPGGSRGAGGRRLPGAGAGGGALQRPHRLRLRHARPGQALPAPGTGRAWGPRSRPAYPSWAWSLARVAVLPRRAAQPVPRRRAGPAPQPAGLPLQRVPVSRRRRTSPCPSSTARRWSTATATTRRS